MSLPSNCVFRLSVYKIELSFFSCEIDEKRVRAQISVRMSVSNAQYTYTYTHRVSIPIDAW